MRLNYVLLSCLVYAFRASQASETGNSGFYFLNAPKDISRDIGTSDFPSTIEKMNVESSCFEVSKSVLEPEIIQQYVRVQEELASILYQQEALIDFNRKEMRDFVSHSLKSFEENSELYDEARLLDVFSIFIASPSSELAFRARKIFDDHLEKLNSQQRSEFLNRLIKHASTETTFVIPKILRDDFVNSERCAAFLNDYFLAVFKDVKRKDYFDYFHAFATNLLLAAEFDHTLRDSTYELLLSGLRSSVMNFEAIWHKKFLDALNLLFDRISGNSSFVNMIIDIMFSENVAFGCDSENYNGSMMSLFIKCARQNAEYFRFVLDASPPAVTDNLGIYLDHLKTATLAIFCFDNIRRLSPQSDEVQYKLALSSAKNLKKIYNVCPEAIFVIPGFFGTIKKVIANQIRLLRDYEHPFNNMSLQIMVNFSLIDFKVTQGDKRIFSAANMAFGLGHLLMKSEKFKEPISNDLSDLIEEVLPILDDVIESFNKLDQIISNEIASLDFAAYLKVINLHKSAEVIVNATDILCLNLIKSRKIKKRGYSLVSALSFTDEAGIAVAGFLHFVKDFLKEPNPEDLPHLRDYFVHLVRKKFLNKIQQLAIKRIFKDFN